MSKKAYFISDCHLGADHMEDTRANERKLVAFLDSIKEDAAELYLLGDVLDYWFEYRNVVPRGFVRFFGKLAELADSGVKITWFIGNHDIWIFDYIPSELGIEVIDGMAKKEILGSVFEMQHGDAIGGNLKFRVMRRFFRNRFCQWLYSGIHPRWTVGFASGCSRRSRLKKSVVGEWPTNLYESLKKYVETRIANGSDVRYFIFGHLHNRKVETLPDGRLLVILGAWVNDASYAVFDGTTLHFKSFS